VALGLTVLACHVSTPQPAGQDSQAAPASPVPTAAPAAVTTPVATATPVTVTLGTTATAPPPVSPTPIRTPAPSATAEPSAAAISTLRELVPGVARIGEPTAPPALTTPAVQSARGPAPASAGPATTSTAALGGATLYLVKRGDTLSSIAGRYRVTVEAIALANGLDDRDFIRAGQSLRLP
jgi:LysM repeat protein